MRKLLRMYCWSLLLLVMACSATVKVAAEAYPVEYIMILRDGKNFIPVASCGPFLVGVLDAHFQQEIGTTLKEKATGVFYILDLWAVNIGEAPATLYSPRVQLVDSTGRRYAMSETGTLTSSLSSSDEYSHIMLFLELTPNIQYIIRLVFDVEPDFDPQGAKLGIAPGEWGSAEEYHYIWARKMSPEDFL